MRHRELFSYILIACFAITNFKTLLSPFAPSAVLNLLNLGGLSLLFIGSLYWSITRNGPVFGRLQLHGLFLIAMVVTLSVLGILLRDVHPRLAMFGGLRLVMPMMILVILLGMSNAGLERLFRVMNGCFGLFVLVSVGEFLLPSSVRLGIAKFFLSSKLGIEGGMAMYTFREFGGEITRLGSILFEPITFGMVTAFFCVNQFKLRRTGGAILGIVMNVLTLGKSGILTLWITITAKVLGRFFMLTIVTGVALGLYLFLSKYGDVMAGFMASGRTFNDVAVLIKEFSTVGNHMIGLMMGVTRAVEYPFLGHGIGTAGFVIAAEAEKMGVVGPTIFEGNESTIGAMAFQMGYVGLFLYMSIFLHMAQVFLRRRDHLLFGLVTGFCLFCFMSESAFSQVIIGDLFLVAVYWLRKPSMEMGKR